VSGDGRISLAGSEGELSVRVWQHQAPARIVVLAHGYGEHIGRYEHVAAALVRRLNPDLHVRDVLRLLKRTARRPADTGWTPDLGWGILDASAAVAGAVATDRSRPSSRIVLATPFGDDSVVLRLRGQDASPPGVRASGIERYEVWRSVDGRPAEHIATTTDTTVVLPDQPGADTSYYTIAVDRVGNRERRPRGGDGRVRTL